MIPEELKALKQWVFWKTGMSKDGKPTKIPYDPKTRQLMSTTDPKTWGTFTEAMTYKEYSMDGIGFVFSDDDNYCGIDFDACIDEKGKISEKVLEWIEKFDSYTEYSPSKKGLHIIIRGVKPGTNCKKNEVLGCKCVEIYDSERYFTFTGDVFSNREKLRSAQKQLKEFYELVFDVEKKEWVPDKKIDASDDDLLKIMFNSKNGEKIKRLWDGNTSDYASDDSRADLALISHLAFYAGGDENRIDGLFRRSGLCRQKWIDRKDYRQRTIEMAKSNIKEYYTPSTVKTIEFVDEPGFSKYSFEDEMEPVFIKNSSMLKEKWLKIRKISASNQTDASKLIFSLQDPNMFLCCDCQRMFVSKEKPDTCPKCKKGTIFTKITGDFEDPKGLWKVPIWEDVDVDMFEVYDRLMNVLQKTIKFVEPIQYKLFALWIIATYKHPLWDTIPYLHFKGLIESGKTRSMELAKMIGYRAVLVSGISFQAVVRANHIYNATLMIDEIDSKLDERSEVGRQFADFLKAGYKKGAMYVTCDLNNQEKLKYYNNYGPKILVGEGGIHNPALLSRSITFEMEQDDPEIRNLSDVSDECTWIQTRLLNYRFKTCTAEQMDEKIPLFGRYREIFDCLIRTAKHIGQSADDVIEYAMKQRNAATEELQGTVEFDVLRSIFDRSCQGTLDAPEGVKINDILEDLQWNDEEKAKNRQRLGYILKNLGLKTKHRRDGAWISTIDDKNDHKLKYLFKRYKISSVDRKEEE